MTFYDLICTLEITWQTCRLINNIYIYMYIFRSIILYFLTFHTRTITRKYFNFNYRNSVYCLKFVIKIQWNILFDFYNLIIIGYLLDWIWFGFTTSYQFDRINLLIINLRFLFWFRFVGNISDRKRIRKIKQIVKLFLFNLFLFFFIRFWTITYSMLYL